MWAGQLPRLIVDKGKLLRLSHGSKTAAPLSLTRLCPMRSDSRCNGCLTKEVA